MIFANQLKKANVYQPLHFIHGINQMENTIDCFYFFF